MRLEANNSSHPVNVLLNLGAKFVGRGHHDPTLETLKVLADLLKEEPSKQNTQRLESRPLEPKGLPI